MKQSTKYLRSFLAGLLAFLMALSVVLTTLCSVAAILAHSPSFTLAVVKKSGYVGHVQEELKEEFISYGKASNIDESFFTEFFEKELTADYVTADTEKMVENFFRGADISVNTDVLQGKLLENLKLYAEEKGYRMDSTLLKNLEIIAKELSDFYKNYLSILSESYFKTASNMLVRYRPFLLYGTGAGLFICVLAAVLIRLFFKEKASPFAFYVYAFSGASLMILVAPLAALFMGVADKINIGSAALYSFATGMMKGTLLSAAFSVIVPILLTVLFAVLYVCASKKESKKKTD